MIAFIEYVPGVIFTVCGVCTIGIICGWPAAHWIGRKLGDILSCLPTERFQKAPPLLGIPRAMVMRGDIHGAVAKYEEMLVEYPAEKELHYRLLELVLGRLGDHSHGEAILRRALEKVPGARDRESLVNLHDSILSGDYHPGAGPPHWLASSV